jgi:hypothetical protein
MNIRRLVMWITFLAVFAMSARVSIDSDTWWHLRAGQWIVENRAVPQVDPFSYTRAGAAWQYPGWLVEAPMYLLYRAFGPGGLNLWTAVMVTLAFVFIWQTLSGGVFLRAFVTILAAAVSGVYWAARPYLVTFLLAAVYLWILENYRWKADEEKNVARRLWWLPVLMVVWANSHGGFAIGFILAGVYWFSELTGWFLDLINRQNSLKDPTPANQKSEIINHKSHLFRLTIIGILMVLAVCLNPSGLVMLAYPFKTISIGALGAYIQEWQSPDFHQRAAQPFIWLLLLTLGALGISRKRLALSDFLLVSGFAYMSLLAWRNVALFALAAPPVLTRHAAPVLDGLRCRLGFREAPAIPRKGQSRLNWILLGLVALAALVKAATVLPSDANLAEIRKTMPVEAVTFIKKSAPPGRLFNSYNWGGYLLWELPEYPVFIDGRTDLYDDDLINQWLQVIRGEAGWQAVLDRWQVRLVLLEPGTPVVGQLEQNGWKLLYQDERTVVYGR